MKLRPTGSRLVVKRDDPTTKTGGGIFIPEVAAEKPKEGKVVAVGPGKTLDNGTVVVPAVRVGDKVIFSHYSGTDVKVDGEDFVILEESDVLTIVVEG